MHNDLVWVLDSTKSESLGISGVSNAYIVPGSDVGVDLELFVTRNTWVVLRGHEDRLVMVLRIKRVEEIIEGYYAGDFHCITDVSKSMRLTQGFQSASKYTTQETSNLKLGVTEPPFNCTTVFAEIVTKSIQSRLTPPNKKEISRIKLPLFTRDLRNLAKNTIKAVVSEFNLDQIWATGNGKMGAFSNFAFAVLDSSNLAISPLNELTATLNSLDPTNLLVGKSIESEGDVTQESICKTPAVDTDFNQIDPEKVFARKFVAGKGDSLDPAEILKKTEHAERLHQSILKDVCEELIRYQITPYESSSIDLMFVYQKVVRVVEVKSATADNILQQAAKGAFQLACYLNELSKDCESPRGFLLLQKVNDAGKQEFVSSALGRLGIETLFYDGTKAWPNRVCGLL